MATDRRNRSGRLILLVVWAVSSLWPITATALSPGDQQLLREALQSQSDNWAPGAVEQIVSGISDLEQSLGRSITSAEVADIARGLVGPGWHQPAEEWMHPLMQKRNELKVVDGVRRYLVHDPVPAAQRREVASAARTYVQRWADNLRAKYPQMGDVIDQAVAKAWEQERERADNPLNVNYMRSIVAPERAEAQFKQILASMAATESKEELYEQVHLAMQQCLMTLVENPIPRSERSEALQRAEQALEDRREEVVRWQDERFDKQVAQRREAREHQRLLEYSHATPEAVRKELDQQVEDLPVTPQTAAEKGQPEPERLVDANAASGARGQNGSAGASAPQTGNDTSTWRATIAGSAALLAIACAAIIWAVRKRRASRLAT